jgi:hypothetical protein
MVNRLSCVPAAGAALLSVAILQDRAAFGDSAARDAVARSRAAVAAPGAFANLRGLLLRGRVRIPQAGSRFDEGELEIRILLPNRFSRTDKFGGRVQSSRDPGQFARLMLGSVVYFVPALNLTARSTAEEAFAGTAAVDVAGRSFSARLVFDAASMVPLRLTDFGSGSVSTVVSFADRRQVGAYLLPFRVTTQIPERVLETLMFDDIVVNPPLSAAHFR